MVIRERDIAFERGDYWVLRVRTGFEVYRIGVTHSTRCAVIGFKGAEGMRRAIAEIDRRISLRRIDVHN